VSSQKRVACFSLQGKLPDKLLQAGILLREAGLSLRGLMVLKSFAGMGQEVVTPMVALGLADLMLGADIHDSLALEALNHDQGF